MSEVTPVPAATVMVVRDAADGIEVLMMERNLKSAFMPGAYVFPGGALDAADNTAEALALCSGISDEQASRALGIAAEGLAYWVAAIRESFEEAALLMAYGVEGRLVALEDPHVIERFRRHRHALNHGERSLLDILRDERLVLAADRLVYFSHWITPVTAPRRYDTRFFVAAAPPEQVPLHDDYELVSHLWVRPADALDRCRQNRFKLRLPTMRTLEEFSAYASVDALMKAMRAKRSIPAILPRLGKDGARLVPGDPGYEAMVAPELQEPWKT